MAKKTEEVPSHLICNRMGTGLYVPPDATLGFCSTCHRKIHVAPSSRKAQAKWPGIKLLCMECAFKLLPEGETECVIGPGQREEFVAMGHMPEQILNRATFALKRDAQGHVTITSGQRNRH